MYWSSWKAVFFSFLKLLLFSESKQDFFFRIHNPTFVSSFFGDRYIRPQKVPPRLFPFGTFPQNEAWLCEICRWPEPLESSILTRAKRATNRNNATTNQKIFGFFGGEHSLGEYTGVERSGGIFLGRSIPRTAVTLSNSFQVIFTLDERDTVLSSKLYIQYICYIDYMSYRKSIWYMSYKQQYRLNYFIFTLKHNRKIWILMIMFNRLVKSYKYPSLLIKTIFI